MVRISLKASSTIKPAEPTASRRLWLSDLDLVMPFTHATFVYFYMPSNANASTFFSLDILKISLSRALVHFYPFAGRLVHGQGGRLELDCNAAGVLFCEAECNAEIADFGDFTPTPELRDLVPHVDYNSHISEWPLLVVQLTFFRCGGVCLGVGCCHTVVDGNSVTHFISAWTRLARGEDDICVRPVFDRAVLRAREPAVAPTFEHLEFEPPPRMIDGTEQSRKETLAAMLKLTGEQVESIRRAANSGTAAKVQGGYSRFQAVAGHVWRCACMARGLHPDQPTKFHTPVDGRNRFRPPIPSGYFGNVLKPTAVVARSGDLVSGELSVAVSRIRGAVERADDEYMRSALDFLSGQTDLTPYRRGGYRAVEPGQVTFYGCPNLALTSLLRFPFYDSDFGWGPPVYVGPAALGFDGKGYLVPTRGEDEGAGGGIVLALRLQTEHMEAFKRLFYNILRSLL